MRKKKEEKKDQPKQELGKFQLRLTDLRGIAGKDLEVGSVVAEGTMLIPGMTIEDINRAISIKEVIACEV